MAKKQNTLITALIVAGVVGGGLYWWNKRKQAGKETDIEPGGELPSETEPQETATVTAKSKGDIYDAIEKAQEIASNTKDAIVTVKDAADNIIAEVTSGAESDPSKREERKAKRAARRKARKEKRKLRKSKRRPRRRRRRK